MDIFLVIGILGGISIVIAGLLMIGSSAAMLLNTEAIMIIILGTIMAVMNSFPKKDFKKIPKIIRVLFSDKNTQDPAEIVTQIVGMSQSTRREGLLSLESTIQGLDNKFMKKGFEMVIDGLDPDLIREVLEIEIESLEERHRLGASIFATAGGSAPTLGVLGAVIGLIGALGNLNDVEALGESISHAFIATVYGIFTGYVLCHPFSSRLKRKSLQEVECMNIILEGVLAIQAGNNSKSIERKLVGMLEPNQRIRFEENK